MRGARSTAEAARALGRGGELSAEASGSLREPVLGCARAAPRPRAAADERTAALRRPGFVQGRAAERTQRPRARVALSAC
jgi:hypothetical protein